MSLDGGHGDGLAHELEPILETCSAVPASVAASARTIGPRAGAELTALIFLALGLLGVLAVVFLDVLDMPTFERVPTTVADDVRQQMMQVVIDKTIDSNARTKILVQTFALARVAMSSLAGIASCVALMLK